MDKMWKQSKTRLGKIDSLHMFAIFKPFLVESLQMPTLDSVLIDANSNCHIKWVQD